MKTEPQHGKREGKPSAGQVRSSQGDNAHYRKITPAGSKEGAEEGLINTAQLALSSEDIENVIDSIEQEYGSILTEELKKTMREEISTAVPELTRALMPLIAEAGEEGVGADKLQQEWVKTFMEIMLPHMQKIVSASQQQ